MPGPVLAQSTLNERSVSVLALDNWDFLIRTREKFLVLPKPEYHCQFPSEGVSQQRSVMDQKSFSDEDFISLLL